MPIQPTIYDLLKEARYVIDVEVNCHTPEYHALNLLERAVSLIDTELADIRAIINPLTK
jgi:hypothetical protein